MFQPQNEVLMDYDDVLIKPRYTSIRSRKDVSLIGSYTCAHGGVLKGVPIIVANLDTTGTLEMASVLSKYHMFTCLHKFYEAEEIFDAYMTGLDIDYVFVSVGMGSHEIYKLQYLYARLGDKLKVCIDVANGYTESFFDRIKTIREMLPNNVIMAGNVATPEILTHYKQAGADIVKIGIGPGNFCRTRITAGVGIPQLSAILSCQDEADRLGLMLCADGGVNELCDFAKGFAAGADFVMAGSMFAGFEESGGELVNTDDGEFKITYGMSSETAMKKHYKGIESHRASEGRTVMVPFKGYVTPTVMDIFGSLRSTMTYTDTRTITGLFKNATLVRVNSTINKAHVANTIGN